MGGTITIVKDADPADGTDFDFTSDAPNNPTFHPGRRRSG